MQHARRVPPGRSENHARLFIAGTFRHSHCRPGLVRRKPRRTRNAHELLPQFFPRRRRERHPRHRVSRHQLRRLSLSNRRRRHHRRRNDASISARERFHRRGHLRRLYRRNRIRLSASSPLLVRDWTFGVGRSTFSPSMRREDLPIFELESSIVENLRAHSRLIIQAPTGSGKSTQVPQILLDHGLLGDGQVVILQPRRLATRLLAARVATERKSRLGDEVGYQIRFENVTSTRTRIRFVTEEILLRQLIQEPELRGISAILFDEFHERHLYGDITLARTLTLQASSRPDLKLAVMSATLDAGALEKYLAPCSLLTSAGRAFPVDIEYLPKPVGGDDYPIWDLAADELERLAPETEGDVLIFMPGKYEIGRTISSIRASRVSDRFVVLPLHGELPPADQDAALAHYPKRRAIVATNVAETSLTITGVRVVIDSGLARIARFDPRRGINTLLVEKISRASADQRAGRAGRTAPGRCLRLWTEREHLERTAQELPEVKRLDLAEVVLTLKASGIEDVASFPWLEQPDSQALARAEQLLGDLGALANNEITALGPRMLAIPVHARYARMLLAAHEDRCVPAIALIAALTQGRNLLRRLDG